MSAETSNKTWKTKFSIFDPVITYEHREFYEKIVNESQWPLSYLQSG